MISGKNIKELLQKNLKDSLFDTLLDYSTSIEAKLREYAKNVEIRYDLQRNEFPEIWDDEVKVIQLFFWQTLFNRRHPFTGDETEFEEFYLYYLHPINIQQAQLKKYDCQFRRLFPIPNSGEIAGYSLKKILELVKKGNVEELSKINAIFKEIIANIINGEAPKYWTNEFNRKSFIADCEREKDARKMLATFLMTET